MSKAEPKVDPVSALAIERQSILAEERARDLWQKKYGTEEIKTLYADMQNDLNKYNVRRKTDMQVPKREVQLGESWLDKRDRSDLRAQLNPLPQDRHRFPQTTTQEVGWHGQSLELFGVGQHAKARGEW